MTKSKKNIRNSYSKAFICSFIEEYSRQELSLLAFQSVHINYKSANRWAAAVNVPNRSTKSLPTSQSEWKLIMQQFLEANNC